MILGAPGTVWGVWCLAQQLWNGFDVFFMLMGLLCLFALFGPIVLYCLETVCITSHEVVLKLGPVVLRRIPVREIRTVINVAIYIGRGGSCCEIITFLSLKEADEMIRMPSEHPREALHKYFEAKMKYIFLPLREGIWLYDSDSQVAGLLPNAESYCINK